MAGTSLYEFKANLIYTKSNRLSRVIERPCLREERGQRGREGEGTKMSVMKVEPSDTRT